MLKKYNYNGEFCSQFKCVPKNNVFPLYLIFKILMCTLHNLGGIILHELELRAQSSLQLWGINERKKGEQFISKEDWVSDLISV